jgi:hypothetical protein
MRLLKAFTLLALVGLLSAEAAACICGGPPGPERAAEGDVVFSGVLEFVKDHTSAYPHELGSGLIEYRFRVGQSWQGEPSELVSVFSDKSSCGARFEMGRKYFICAFEDNGWKGSILKTNICDCGPFEYALECRVGLSEPEVVDDQLAESAPTIVELESYVSSEDAVLARHAVRALAILKDRHKWY